jgi:hypothetical protein
MNCADEMLVAASEFDRSLPMSCTVQLPLDTPTLAS